MRSRSFTASSKTFKIGEYAVGGIIKVSSSGRRITISALDWNTKAIVSTRAFDIRELRVKSQIDSYLNELTSSYYAEQIMEYIFSPVKTGNKKKVKYLGYTIEESGMNYYVTDPKGHRAFGEVPATIETAKKWIDWDVAEKQKKKAKFICGGEDEQKRMEKFAEELAKLSKKYGIAIQSVGGVEFGEIESIRYSDDSTSGDLMSSVRWKKLAKRRVALEGLNEFESAYVEAALWSSTDDEGIPLDSNYDIGDIDRKTLSKMKSDCRQFEKDMDEYLYPDNIKKNNAKMKKRMEQGGHDFWLTRNGHGAGFWDNDRGWTEEEGKAMTDYSKKKGTFDLYVGDDGKIYS